MATGTLRLTQNSISVNGTGTAFTSELKVGDVIFVALGGINYTLVVSKISTDTYLELARAFTGNTESGVAWSAIPQAALIGIHAQLAADTAWSRRASILDRQNWQQIFAAAETATITLPDGTAITGPSWRYILDALGLVSSAVKDISIAVSGKASAGKNSDITSLSGLTTALSMSQGGLGATTPVGGRNALGLGTSATRNAYSATGDMLSIGDYGLGSTTIVGGNASGNMIANEACGFYAGTLNTPTATSYSGIKVKINDNVGFSMAVRQNRAFIQSVESGTSMGWREITLAAPSDAILKGGITYGRGADSWANVSAMQPVTFFYKDDAEKTTRRGFIAQDLEKIDPQYIKKMNGGVDEDGKLKEIMTLDTNPLLMDALIVLKLLIDKDEARNKEISEMKTILKTQGLFNN